MASRLSDGTEYSTKRAADGTKLYTIVNSPYKSYGSASGKTLDASNFDRLVAGKSWVHYQGSMPTPKPAEPQVIPKPSGALLPSSSTGSYSVQGGTPTPTNSTSIFSQPVTGAGVTGGSTFNLGTIPSKPNLTTGMSPSNFNTTTNPAPGGYVSTTMKPSDIGPSNYDQIAKGLPQHQGQLTKIDTKVSSPYGNGTSVPTETRTGGSTTDYNTGMTGSPLLLPGSTGTKGPLAGNTPKPGLSGLNPSYSPGAVPATPTLTSGSTGGGVSPLPPAPEFNNPFAGLKNENGEQYRGALLGRMNDEAARQNAAMRDTIRNNYAEQGMGGSGFEKLANFQNDLGMRSQMSQNFNSSLTDMADKSMAFEMQKASGTMDYQNSAFDRYKALNRLPHEIDQLKGQAMSQLLQNQDSQVRVQMLLDTYQDIIRKERAGVALSEAEAAQAKWVNDHATELAAMGFAASLLPGMGSMFAASGARSSAAATPAGSATRQTPLLPPRGYGDTTGGLA